jgi:hypothetical protein
MEVKEMITIYEEKGIEKGELIGDIRIAQLMKGLSMSDKKELEKLSIDDLKNKLQELAKG